MREATEALDIATLLQCTMHIYLFLRGKTEPTPKVSSITKIAMPAIYNVREFAEAGGAGIYVASIAVIALLYLHFLIE